MDYYQYILINGKSEIEVQSTNKFNVGDEVGVYIKPDLIHIMKKDVTTNIYEGYITKNGEQIDLTDVDVLVQIGFTDITLTDNEEDGMVYGNVISSIYKGDHYQVIVRTDENEEDYIIDTEYTYNISDRVGIIIPSSKIKMKLKVNNNDKTK